MTHPPFQALSQRMIIQIIQQNSVEAVLFSEATQKSSNQHILHSLPILDTLPPSSSFQFGKRYKVYEVFNIQTIQTFTAHEREMTD